MFFTSENGVKLDSNVITHIPHVKNGRIKTLHIKDVISEDMGQSELIRQGKGEIGKLLDIQDLSI